LPRGELPFREFEKMILLTIRKSINWSTHLFTGMSVGHGVRLSLLALFTEVFFYRR